MAKKMKKRLMKKKKKFSFHGEVEEAWKYVKKSDNYILVVVGVFALFFMFGFVFPYVAPAEVLEPILEEIQKWIEELLRKQRKITDWF